jgi:hypothetical protein
MEMPTGVGIDDDMNGDGPTSPSQPFRNEVLVPYPRMIEFRLMPRTNPRCLPFAGKGRRLGNDSGVTFQQGDRLLTNLLLKLPQVTKRPTGGKLSSYLILQALPPLLDRRMVKPLTVRGGGSVGRIQLRQTTLPNFSVA